MNTTDYTGKLKAAFEAEGWDFKIESETEEQVTVSALHDNKIVTHCFSPQQIELLGSDRSISFTVDHYKRTFAKAGDL